MLSDLIQRWRNFDSWSDFFSSSLFWITTLLWKIFTEKEYLRPDTLLPESIFDDDYEEAEEIDLEDPVTVNKEEPKVTVEEAKEEIDVGKEVEVPMETVKVSLFGGQNVKSEPLDEKKILEDIKKEVESPPPKRKWYFLLLLYIFLCWKSLTIIIYQESN